jgi:glucosamine kinase
MKVINAAEESESFGRHGKTFAARVAAVFEFQDFKLHVDFNYEGNHYRTRVSVWRRGKSHLHCRTAVIKISVAYYLGIDGGGTKTTCVVGDETAELATATSGPSNITRVGEASARESLHEAILHACAAAKIDPREVLCACVGVAGVGREETASVVRKIVAEVIAGRIEVVGDMQIAMHAAVGTGPGVIMIAGTGSIAYGRNVHGQTARAGGWGFAISDEGSAHWIGRMAVSSVLRKADETAADANRHPPPLFREMQSVWPVESVEDLARTANSTPNFAALLPAVVAASSAGDELARQVLQQAGKELAQLAGTVIRRLFAPATAAIPLAMVGGVFSYAAITREVFCDTIRQIDARIEVMPDVVDPVVGALEMARKPD